MLSMKASGHVRNKVADRRECYRLRRVMSNRKHRAHAHARHGNAARILRGEPDRNINGCVGEMQTTTKGVQGMSLPVPVWHGVIDKDGTLLLEAPHLFTSYIKWLKNHAVTLVLKKRTRRKSTQQLGYLFGVVYPVIADELGYRQYEVEQVHDAVMRELRGLKPEPNPLKLRVSLAAMSHEDVSAYIEDVRHWALTAYSIVTPDADKAEPMSIH